MRLAKLAVDDLDRDVRHRRGWLRLRWIASGDDRQETRSFRRSVREGQAPTIRNRRVVNATFESVA